MALRFSDAVTPAAWLVASPTPWDVLVTLGPGGYPACSRVRYIPDPVRVGQAESDVDLPASHPSDHDQARRAIDVLAAFTATPDDAFSCVWDGYGDLPFPPGLEPRPWVVLPHRRYALLRGELDALGEWNRLLGNGFPPAFVWPADRSWVFASDVDPHWAGIVSSVEAQQALLRAPGLDVVAADRDRRQPCYR